MRISHLTLINYRCFEKLELALPQNFMILVGNNGSGKSAVLDGLAVGLASFFLGMEGASAGGIHRSDVRTESFELGSRIERQAQYPSRIQCKGEIEGKSPQWARALNTKDGKTTYGEASELSDPPESYGLKWLSCPGSPCFSGRGAGCFPRWAAG